jgi:hypothetical protein
MEKVCPVCLARGSIVSALDSEVDAAQRSEDVSAGQIILVCLRYTYEII